MAGCKLQKPCTSDLRPATCDLPPSPDIPCKQIIHRLAPLDQPRLAVFYPDYGRPARGVVVAAHAQLVRAAGRHGQQIAWPHRWQLQAMDQDVACLAVRAGNAYLCQGAIAVTIGQ